MSSTNLGASQRWQALIADQTAQVGGQVVTLPGYFRRYNLRTAWTENDQGDWYKYTVSLAGPVEDRAVREVCKKFAVAARDQEVEMAAPEPQGGGGVGSQVLDEEIPI